ncbi:protein of unknown function (plasmid) [Pararobbsia alpina]
MDFRATLTRRSLARPARPLEFESEATDGTHTITINRSVARDDSFLDVRKSRTAMYRRSRACSCRPAR